MKAIVFFAIPFALSCRADAKPTPGAPTPKAVDLPGGTGGIGFDDLRYSAALHRVIAPAGRTGNLVLIDPDSQAMVAIGGFSQGGKSAGHGDGTTSADEGKGLLFASDRTARRVVVVDPAAKKIVAEAPLGGGPDYVRFVAPTGEVWVTEPGAKRIEVFRLSASGPPTLTPDGTIAVSDGPESLVIDATRGRAYSHEWGGRSMAIDLKTRKVVATWANGCKGSRGIALDEPAGLLFVGCDEGRVATLDVGHDGKAISALDTGVTDVDIIAFNPSLRHLYVPGESGDMAIVSVSPAGALAVKAIAPAASGAHCVTSDERGGVWVCDPAHGRLLVYHDPG